VTAGDPVLKSYPCAICNVTDRTLVFRKNGRAIKRSFQIVRCRGCGHHYVDPRVSDEDLGSIYDDAYYRGRGFDTGIDFYSQPSPELLGSIERTIELVASIARRPLETMTWLDYGCGAGTQVLRAAAHGAAAFGYDMGPPARAICAQKGVKVLDDEELAEKAGTFDVVSAVEVIEHVTEPRAFLRTLTQLLKIGGILYVQTGNWNLIRHVPGRPYVMPEGHLQYFTPSTMRRLFATSGLREANVPNPSWIGYKAIDRLSLPAPARDLVALLERTLRVVAPGYAQFPVGIRVD
jgi:2-polyprenyl-3-methyl-5-hydroxy-6-metoxy-1,4-benzoquinol methylase